MFVFGKIGTHDAKPLRSLEINSLAPKINIKDVKTRTAFLCYSSGTTGRPKGVETTHYNVVANILQNFYLEKDFIRPTDVWCATLPLFHSFGMVVVLFLALYSGISVVIISKFELESVIYSSFLFLFSLFLFSK